MKLLHLSDCHFSIGFVHHSPLIRRSLQAALRNSFRQAINYALQHGVDVIAIAGDLFDTNSVRTADEDFLFREVQRALDAGIWVVYAAGNHDDRGADVLSPEFRALERFVLFADSAVRSVTLDLRCGERVTVVGSGFGATPATAEMYPPRGESVTIGVAHMSVDTVSAPPTKSRYNANSLASIERLGYDYFALGHIHKRQRLSERVAYSGSLHGLHINETGPKGGYLVELRAPSSAAAPPAASGATPATYGAFGAPPAASVSSEDAAPSARVSRLAEITVTEVNFSGIVFEQRELDITGVETMRQLSGSIAQELASLAPESYVRIRAYGATPLYPQLRREERLSENSDAEWLTDIAERCGMTAVELRGEQIRPEVDLDQLRRENTLLGIVLRSIDALSPEKLRAEGMRLSDLGCDDLEALRETLREEALSRLLAYQEE